MLTLFVFGWISGVFSITIGVGLEFLLLFILLLLTSFESFEVIGYNTAFFWNIQR
jgi:uncharacterized membrane protein YfcA